MVSVTPYGVQQFAVNLFKWFLVLSTRVFLWLYVFVLNVTALNASWKKPQKLPPIKFEFYEKSASELKELLMTQQITSRQIVAEYITRIVEVDNILNCVVQNRFEEALKEAEKVDEIISQADDKNLLFEKQPLLGIPFTVKENLAVKGMKHSSARTRVPVQIAEADAVAVNRLRRFGAIPLLVSNAPELCLNLETVSKNGRTLNPYDTTKSTGGSSGGEAALLGAGASVMGLASDVAGSIRIPAMFCGVFGHKPTPGYIPVEGHIPSSSDPMWDYHFTVAPMTKRADDLLLMFRLLVSENVHNHLRLNEPVNVSELKVYYMFGEGRSSLTQNPPSPRVKKALQKAVFHLKSNFHCQSEEVQLPYLVDSMNYNGVLVTMKGVENVYQRSDDPDDWNFWSMLYMIFKKLTGSTDANFGAMLWGPMKYSAIIASKFAKNDIAAEVNECRRRLSEMLGDNAVFLYPTFSVEAQPHNDLASFAFDVSYTTVFNVLGLPATQCPIKVEGRLPVGVQVVAGPDQDRLCFAVARALESSCGGWIPPSSS